jgi:hypothetical protein
MKGLQISRYKDNAIAPVIFMVDDIANVSIKQSRGSNLKIGEDWGQYGRDKNSMWDFLSTQLLEKFPHIKTTLFLVTDKRAPMALDESYSYSEPITKDQKFKTFLKYLDKQPNVELAYHGTTHGVAAKKHDEFLQEWESFRSLDHALEEIARGKELFKTVLGDYPRGGKYCGYVRGEYGDDSISKADFKWWCYHWDGIVWDKGSEERIYSYELGLNQGVVDIPTTVDASTLSLKMVHKLFSRKYLKSCYLYLKERKTLEKHIDSLYDNRQVIAIQEHSSPYRTDKILQYPNIVSDIDNLKHIFSILAKKDVWYATCSELADYYLNRLHTEFIPLSESEFLLKNDQELSMELTLSMPLSQRTFSLYDGENKVLGRFQAKRSELYVTHRFKANSIYRIIKEN